MATKYVSGRVKELKVGITNYSESKESLSVIGIVSATKYYGDGSNLTGTQTPGIDTTGTSDFNNINATGIITASSFDGAISEWILGANGSSDYTFTGPGLTGAENDPTIYLKRGQKYNFKNSMGAHPFQIRTAINGSAYNDGIVNNGVSNGTLIWDVQFDAPDILYYQCTAHAGMVGKIYIGNSGDSATINNLKVTGVSTYESPLDIESSVLITGITTIGGLVDINAGGQANTFKVEDLTDNRVVIAGTGGELEDDSNLTFNGTQFNVGSGVTIYQATGIVSATKFHGDGSSLTGIDASALKFGGVVKAQANASGVVVTGVLTATTFAGNGAGLTNVPTGINTGGTSDFTTLKVSTLLDVDGHTELDDVNVSGVSTFNANVRLLDNDKLQIGTSQDLELYHDTTDSRIENSQGDIKFKNAGSYYFFDEDGGETLASFINDGAVNIYFAGSKKLETTTSGITITGTATANAFVGNGAGLTNVPTGINTGGTSDFVNLNLGGTLSVGGTSIFNSPIVGVATFSGATTFSGAIDANGGADISGGTGLTASTAKISDLTNNRVVIVGTSGELEDTTKLTFDGSTLAIVGDATFTGNVSVAGTLTSEDKTNIDSIGIVTARTGVRVTSGGIIVSSGTATFNDSVVASSAKVSDLTSGRVVVAGTAGELEDASTFTFSGGTVTASAFAGDGSALTGITAAGTGAIGGITVKDEGVTVGTAGSISSFDFRGSNVACIANTGAAGLATVTVSDTPSFTNLNVAGVSTFAGALDINAGVSISGLGDFAASTFNNIRLAYSADNEIDTSSGNLILDSAGGTVEVTDNLTVTGTCQATDFNSTSDIRLKDNIQTIEDPLAKLVQIEGVSFNWKENNKPALGVIADQVQEILPELVTDGDPKTVNYNGLIGLLIEAVKEQQIQIDELKSKLP